MDPSRFAMTLAVLLIGVVLGRVVVASAGRTGDVMATLFVPPDRALGWPHGVQESDEPWGWRGAASPAGDRRPGDESDEHDPPSPGSGRSDWVDPPSGRFVVPVGPVDPVHVGARPH
jgi:hypothetical protein